MKAVVRTAYLVGGVLIVSGLIHVAILIATGASWQGPVSLRKPASFGLSFGITLINVTLIASVLSLRDRSRAILIGGLTAACVLETVLVSMQAWREVPSHFNLQTPFDAAVAQALALGGVALVVIIIALTVSAMRHPPSPPALGIAIRAGLLALVGAQLAGAVMIATGVRQVIGGHADAAFANGGWLKPLHAVLMHGILVLPLLAWLVSRTAWSERARTRAVNAGVLIYVMIGCGALALSVYGRR